MDLGLLPEGWVSWEIEPIEPGSRRTLDERAVGRGSVSRAVVSKRVMELPAGSPIRKKFVTSAIRGAFGLMNRLEFDGMLRTYAEDVTFQYDDGLVVGITGEGRGRQALRDFLLQFDDVFEQRLTFPRLVVDPGGATFAGFVEARTREPRSGMELTVPMWNVWTIENGVVARQVVTGVRDAALSQLPGY